MNTESSSISVLYILHHIDSVANSKLVCYCGASENVVNLLFSYCSTAAP